jgi:DNA repair protein RadC
MNAMVTEKPTTVFIREVTARYRRGKHTPQKIDDARGVWSFASKVIADNSREHFIALFLDAAHQVVSYSIVAIGTATSCPIHPRELFQHAVLTGAIAIIIAHNHPSGSINASVEDKNITRKLEEAGRVLGIPIIDHVIFTDDGYFSFDERGWINDGRGSTGLIG